MPGFTADAVIARNSRRSSAKIDGRSGRGQRCSYHHEDGIELRSSSGVAAAVRRDRRHACVTFRCPHGQAVRLRVDPHRADLYIVTAALPDRRRAFRAKTCAVLRSTPPASASRDRPGAWIPTARFHEHGETSMIPTPATRTLRMRPAISERSRGRTSWRNRDVGANVGTRRWRPPCPNAAPSADLSCERW